MVGFRTPAGRITTTQSFNTMQIPRLVRGKPCAWEPQVCLSWGQQFISCLKEILTSDSHYSGDKPSPRVWRVFLNPKDGIEVFELDSDAVKEVAGGEDRVGFLPTWYYELVASTVISKDHTPDLTATSTTQTSDADTSSAPSHEGWNI